MAANSIYNNGGANLMSFGQHGGTYAATAVSSGVVTIPAGKVIVAVTSLDAATTLTCTAETGFPDPPDAEVIPIGITIYGRFTAMTVGGTGGAVIAYFGP